MPSSANLLQPTYMQLFTRQTLEHKASWKYTERTNMAKQERVCPQTLGIPPTYMCLENGILFCQPDQFDVYKLRD